MNEWRDTTLGELFRIKHGFAFKGEFFSDSGEAILLTPGNFRPEGGLKLKGDKEKFYSGPIPDEFVLHQGDMLVAMTDLTQNAPILGSAAVVPESGRFLHNQRLGKIVDLNMRATTPGFVYCLFNSPAVRAQIRATATGATVRHTAPERIYRVRVQLPPLPDQRRIAAILSAYDDLIDNCERRIRLIDEMARALYGEWFALFRYPTNAETLLVNSALKPMPRDWTVEPLARHASIQKGLSYKGEGLTDAGTPMVNLKCIQASGTFRRDGVKPYSGEHKERHRVRPGEIVFANTDLTQAGGIIGSVAQVPRRGFEDGGIASHHISIVRPTDPKDRVWLLFALRDERFRNHARTHASGTTVLGFRTEDAEAYQLAVPPRGIRDEFTAHAAPLLSASEVLEDRIENLRNTRDVLLPRLLSGQLMFANAA
jgi:type I restriction enzyme, S subunit